MTLSERLDQWHHHVRRHRWLHYFAVFNRVALAAGFIPSGMVKVLGERFTDLDVNHPLGHYLDALFQTGSYYTFIGVMQVTAAVLLLIPRTALIGAVVYFPIILNIFVLSLSVRFQGSLLTAPLMILANLYLLCWDYHKFRLLFPWNYRADLPLLPDRNTHTLAVPWRFGMGVFAAVAAVVVSVFLTMNFALMPLNRLPACQSQCGENADPAACMAFCACIHEEGRPLGECLAAYENAVD